MIDPDLSHEARAFIELARDSHDPGDDDRARVRAVLASRIGVAAGLGLVAGLGAAPQTTVSATAIAGAGGGMTAGAVGAGTVALKVIGAAVILSATMVGATVVHRARHPPIARVAVAERAPAPRQDRKAVVGPVVAAGAEVSAPASEPAREGAKVPPTDSRIRSATARRPPRAYAIVPTPPGVADETSFVQAGIVARRSGQPGRALELFDMHARTFPQGVLAEERDVERALALADLGRITEARAAIDRFLRAHSASPLAAPLLSRARLLDLVNPQRSSTDGPGPAVPQRHDPE
jgi:hypothetical protein